MARRPIAAAATPGFAQPARELSLELGNKVTMMAVLIPAGKFAMGGPDTEKDPGNDETQHEVTISKFSFIGLGLLLLFTSVMYGKISPLLLSRPMPDNGGRGS